MTSKLNQKASSILAAFGICVLILLIVLLWVLIGHNGRHGSGGSIGNTITNPQIHRYVGSTQFVEETTPTHSEPVEVSPQNRRSHVEGYGHNVNTELVRPLKISPRPLHPHDIFYEQIYHKNTSSISSSPEHPTLRHHSGHFRHRQAEVWDPHPEYEISAFGVQLHLVLAHDDTFLPPNLRVTHFWTNLTLRMKPEHQTAAGCYYTGKVQGEQDSKVAVSLCGGMTGYIRSKNGNFYIEPAEPFHNSTVQSILHKIHKVIDGESEGRDGVCETTSSDDWSKDELDEIIPINHQHHLSKRDTWTKNFLGPPYRLGHQVGNREFFIETLVVVDKEMADYHKTEANLVHYILTLMSYVALVFKDATIGNPISISVVDIVIANDYEFVSRPKSRKGSKFKGVSAAEMLRNFSHFQHQLLMNRSKPYHHDTAILLSRKKLCRNTEEEQCDTLGLAQLGTMCNPKSSCAIIKDKGLPTSITIAHELGHVLSMPHDDDHVCQQFNETGDVKYIMHKMMQNDSKPWLWSKCSKYFVTEFLESNRAQCLYNEPGQNMATWNNMTFSLPGETFDIDRQCELAYDNGWKICTYMMSPPCRMLWCDQGHGNGCHTQSSFWADGTRCGPGHWCYRGECVHSDRTLLQPVSGGWGPWGAWGMCSRPCGGGIKKSIRACDHPKPANGGPYCIGPSVRYMSCNTSECSGELKDFREEQCAAFNGNTRGILGLTSNVKWVPKYGGILPDHMCKLYCRVHLSSSYYLLSEKVRDGTKCGLNSFDICVNGICRRGGCDNRLDSNNTLDECGICGGDNSQCQEISGTYNVSKPKYGYNRVIRIPKGSSHIDIRQYGFYNDSNYLALVDSETGAYILNGGSIVTQFEKVIMYAGVLIQYSGSNSIIERLNSTPSIQLQKDLVVEFLSVGRVLPPNITFSYMISRDSAPKHTWQLYSGDDEWSSCSALCAGTRYRIPRCVDINTGSIVSDDHCEQLDMDGARSTQQECNMHCRLSWKITARQQCSAHCGLGTREIIHKCVKIEVAELKTDMRNLLDPMADLDETPWAIPVNENHCSHLPKPPAYETCEGPCDATRWEYDQWSMCTKSCDGGYQTRKATCMDAEHNILDDIACEGKEKRVEQQCNMGKCPTWALGDWSPCSVTCGKGIRKKPLYCQLNGRVLNAEACDSNQIPPREEVCMLKRCSSWETGEWRKCSVTCGAGIQERLVACKSIDGHTLEMTHCEDMLRPNSTRICRMDECPDFPTGDINDNSILPIDLYGFKWQWGPWSECSKSCEGGTRSRNVACQNVTGAKDERQCDPKTRPWAVEQCNTHPCTVWRTYDWSECDASCWKRRQVVCQDYTGALIGEKHCPVDKKPEYRTKCTDTAKCQEQHIRHQHLLLRYHWVPGTWSSCSNACIKSRAIYCMDATRTIVNHVYCKHARRPRAHRPCNTNNPNCINTVVNTEKYEWKMSDWTTCTRSCDRGFKYRNVTCHRVGPSGSSNNNAPVEAARCRAETKPNVSEACLTRWCTGTGIAGGVKPIPSSSVNVRWETGAWGACTHQCGVEGRQSRRLRCVNDKGRKTSKKLCGKFGKPRRKQKCNQIKCEYSSCLDVQRQQKAETDSHYELYIGKKRFIKVFCAQMSTSTPLEYLTLPNEGRENYAEVYDRRLKDAETCPYGGQRRDTCDCMLSDSGRAGLTVFTRVRLNVTTMTIVPDDFRFARQIKGAQVPYGTAGDCYSHLENCPQGRFSIDLTGTGLKLAPEVVWVSSGPKASHSVHKQKDTKVNGKCGGYCGHCQPDFKYGLAVKLL